MSARPRHWNYEQATKPDWADFAEPFCAGWNAHKDHGDLQGEDFVRALNEAYETSGAMLAYKVATGMTEAEARAQMGSVASREGPTRPRGDLMAYDQRTADVEAQLETTREALAYVLRHHMDGRECLCGAARSVAEAALRMTVESGPNDD